VKRELDRVWRRPTRSRCPRSDRQQHTSKSPDLLTQTAVANIERQITDQGHNPLPVLGVTQRFYRCADCYAVWPAGARYERVTEKRVCGIYDHSLIWQPLPKRGRPKSSKSIVPSRPYNEGSVMTAAEVCDFLRIHRNTLYRLAKAGGIPYFIAGKDYRFNRETIEKWSKGRA
jgi:excisionase family DNA binding protein